MAGRAIRKLVGSWRHLLVPCILVVLVGVLATLQYRWVGQIADADRQRMQASAQARANQLADEIDRELTTVFFSFSRLTSPGPLGDPAPHLPAPPDAGDNASAIAAEYARWAATSTHPRLVRALFLIDGPEGGRTQEAARTERAGSPPAIRKLPAGGSVFEPTDWPPELAAVRTALATPGESAVRFAPVFEPRVPGLVLPVARLKVSNIASDTSNRIRIVNVVGMSGSLVVELDRDYIRRDWLPALARRYFGGSDGFDYNLAVLDASSPRSLLYVSDPGLGPGAFSRPDIKAPLFRIRTEQIERFVTGRGTGGSGGTPTGNRLFQFSVSAIREHASGAPRAADASGQWQLVLAHRAGSLDAAIAQSRHRNLAISFGILALLAVSLGLVVLSTRRAASLAAQQVEFVAGVSHELRTPLAVICSAAENLADGVVVDGSQVRRYGTLIADEGRRLAEMVEQVMAFAGFHAGGDIAERQAIEPRDLIERALAGAARALERHAVTVEMAIADGVPPVAVNVRAMERAFGNLIDNAIKYGGDNPWVRVSAGWNPDRRRVALSVEDRGLGVAPDEERRIFEPFFRGRDVAASSIHGSGLGLSLVKRIVDAHGGTISVRSARGKGSTFAIHLPAAREVVGPASATDVEEPAG